MVTLPSSPSEIIGHLQRPVSGKELTQFFQLLASQRRCLVIMSVFPLGADETIELRPLSREIAGVTNDKDPEDVTDGEYQAVYTNLHQNHLESLADANMIEYDAERKRIGRGSETTVAGVTLAVVVIILKYLWTPRTKS